MAHPLKSATAFCHWTLEIFLISKNTDKKRVLFVYIWYIFSNSFDFYGVFIGCFNQHDFNFDDVNKILHSRPHGKKGILKLKLYDATNKILSSDSNYVDVECN